MTTTFTRTAKPSTTFSDVAKPGVSGGTVFYAWLFWFTTPGDSGMTNVAKPATTFSRQAKP